MLIFGICQMLFLHAHTVSKIHALVPRYKNRVLRRMVIGCCLALCLNLCIIQTASAQQQELTSEDDHALLYTKQIQFAQDGSPVIRMRIADDLASISMTPEHSFIVYPNGPGNAYITLPGNETYTITARSPRPGAYRYAVILFRSRNQGDLEKEAPKFEKHVTQTDTLALGSVFALKGKVFDNREHLLITSKTNDKNEALKIREQLKKQFPEKDFEIYDELQAYPKLIIQVTNAKGDMTITNANVIWFSFDHSPVNIHNIPDEQGNPRSIRLNGQLIVTPDSHAKLALVQAAGVETILRGIVPAEIFPSAPAAALEAQAIAARTTLISQVGSRHQADPYHLCNKQHCQVYHGLSAATQATDEAIEKTRGQILFSGNELVSAYYSAHCGGASATAKETWALPDKPYLQARTDDADHGSSPKTENALKQFLENAPERSNAFCAKAPPGQKSFSSTKHARWDITLSIDEIQKNLKAQGMTVKKIDNIEIVRRGPSGRVTQIKITGDGKSFFIERELPIRRFFGGLKSALFTMEVSKNHKGIQSVTFHGAGFGHGVGMCQTGAIGMAQRNYSANQILQHYYPSTHIEKLW